MTKIIVFADIHGNTHNLLKLVPIIEKADTALFLGDGVGSLEILPNYINKKLSVVRGNCDLFCRLPDELVLEIAGKRILMTHGHIYNVKNTNREIIKAASDNNVDICLYGHTHDYSEITSNNTMIINVPPLGTSRTLQGGSYLELVIQDGQVTSTLKKV